MSTASLKFKIVDVTPEMARKFLNRNIRPRKVAEYKRAMDKGSGMSQEMASV